MTKKGRKVQFKKCFRAYKDGNTVMPPQHWVLFTFLLLNMNQSQPLLRLLGRIPVCVICH